MIFATLQKLPNNVGNLGKIIVATSFELLPKVRKIAQSGHTDHHHHRTNQSIFSISKSWRTAKPFQDNTDLLYL